MGILWENYDVKTVDYFSCDLDIFDGSIGCPTNVHADEFVFLLSQVRSKVIAFFVKYLLKLNSSCDCN